MTEANEFVANLLTASITQSQNITNQVIDNLEFEVIERRATIAAIRALMFRLLDSDYMPTPSAIERALYPSQSMVDAYKKSSPYS